MGGAGAGGSKAGNRGVAAVVWAPTRAEAGTGTGRLSGSKGPGCAPSRGISVDDGVHFAHRCPERLQLPSIPCHCDRPSAPSGLDGWP